MSHELPLLDRMTEETEEIGAETTVRAAIRDTLREIREILHRRGHLSSRHEALDEVSKLLFAHILSVDNGGGGIGLHLLNSGRPQCTVLHAFVSQTASQFVPRSLSHELSSGDLELGFRSSADSLCEEIILCFSKNLPKSILLDVKSAGQLDILNDTFGQFIIDSFSDEKELGQYLTPTEVVREMVKIGLSSLREKKLNELCSPGCAGKAGVILDPSCGVGSFLAEALRVLYRRAKVRLSKEEFKDWVEEVLANNIVGIDKSERMIRLALVNLALFGIPAANLHFANSLVRGGKECGIGDALAGRASLILTNPPFGAEFSGTDLRGYRIPEFGVSGHQRSIASELLFLERYIDWLAPDGVLVAVVPDNILTNRGIYQKLREHIHEFADVLSVISLPSVTFAAAGTATKTSILHIRKRGKEKYEGRAFFGICSDIGYSVSVRGGQRTKVSSGEGQLPSIRKAAMSNHASKYGRRVRLAQTAHRWDAVYHAGLPRAVQQRLAEKVRGDILLGEIAAISRDRVDPRRFAEEKFKYAEIGDVDNDACTVKFKWVTCRAAPSRARKPIRAGDVILSTVRPERRSIGVVPLSLEGGVCSTGFAVIRSKKIDPYVLARLLQSEFVTAQLLRNNSGIAYPSIDEECLNEVLLPIRGRDLNDLARLGHEIRDLQERTRDVESRFFSMLSGSIKEWEEK